MATGGYGAGSYVLSPCLAQESLHIWVSSHLTDEFVDVIFPVIPELSRSPSRCHISNENTVTLIQNRTPDFVIMVPLAPLSTFFCIGFCDLISLLHLLFPLSHVLSMISSSSLWGQTK